MALLDAYTVPEALLLALEDQWYARLKSALSEIGRDEKLADDLHLRMAGASNLCRLLLLHDDPTDAAPII